MVIGEGTTSQENTVINTNVKKSTIMGKRISVGHSVVLHGCTVEDDCIVGMGSILLDGVTVESDCIVGAGAVVSPGTRVKKGSMALGIPARVVRALKPEELEHIRWNAKEYYKLTAMHRKTSRRVID